MNDLIGCCGLDCEKCHARIATITNDGELRKKTAALWTKLNGVQITPDMIRDVPAVASRAKRRRSATRSARYITASAKESLIPAPTARRWVAARR